MKNSARFKEYSNTTTYVIEAKENEYLYIDKSQIPHSGSGLFTAIPIFIDEVISIFKGEIISDEEALRLVTKGEDRYFINLPDGTIMDSRNVKCFAKYANDANGLYKIKVKNNSDIKLDENGRVCLVAKRKIKAGEEIFCAYGSGYWKNVQKKPDTPSSY